MAQEVLPAARSQEGQHLHVEVGEMWPSDRDGSVWRRSRPTVSSAAFLRYLDETSADNLQLLRTALDESDDE